MSKTLTEMESVLRERFGLQAFREGQPQVIERLLSGRSAAAIFPTGGGKSLCYQLPAVLLKGLTLVVSPLLALMREQVEQLNQLEIPAARLDSSLSAEQARQIMQDVRSQKVKLLYVAPERFFNERFRHFVGDLNISLFAIDEAHCISQWGHNFRPDYLKLARLAKALQAERVLALTATATPAVLADIRKEFDIAPEDTIQTPFYRANLNLRFTPTTADQRNTMLLDRLQTSPPQTTLIYVTLQQTAEQVAELLVDNGLEARAYHAGLPSEERETIQDWFMQSDSAIVVATIAFGMGIDKSNIRAIYHYNTSKSIENYVQEIGRAGRDGLPAVCETLIVPEDRIVLDNFAYGDTPSRRSLVEFVEFLAGQPSEFFVGYRSLAHLTDIREAVIRTLLTYLELANMLEATAPRYDKYQFKPKVTSSHILNQLSGERRQFAASVLAMSVKKKIWFEIKLAHAADRLKSDRSRIVKMLDYFAENGWIELKASGLVHGYRKLRQITDIEGLAGELFEYALNRETGELTRLNELYDLFTLASCQSAALSQHFGQAMDQPCGHCSYCESGSLQLTGQTKNPRLGDSALRGLEAYVRKHPQALSEVRQQTRFLCGLSSPRLVSSRLTREPLYGCCAGLPFETIMQGLTEG